MLAKQKKRWEAQEAGRQAAAAQSVSTDNQGQSSDDTSESAGLDPSGSSDVPEPPGEGGFLSQILDFFNF
ncbi:hypothetical protein ACFVXC_00010 [Streptomyces sp. NPDC058257]|uniref:hypothetical protein n=1 Tax=Streptomyces sp. NPDC058257 TaxID=3346409 RepID=UPI0036EE35B6